MLLCSCFCVYISVDLFHLRGVRHKCSVVFNAVFSSVLHQQILFNASETQINDEKIMSFMSALLKKHFSQSHFTI